MKNSKSLKITTAVLAMAVVMILVAGCTKPPGFKADPTNPYANPNDPNVGVAAPVLTSFSPSGGITNTVIRIVGYNFALGLSNNKLTINGVSATINSVTSIEILATVPASATTGKLELTSGSKVITSTTNFAVLGGTVSTFADVGAAHLEHISFDASGNLYGEDNKTIYKILATGEVTTYAGLNNEFSALWGSVVDPVFGDVYVADRGNFTVKRVSAAKVFSFMAGNGQEGIVDGQGITARFVAPTGMAIDKKGNLYVNDTHRVRKISTEGLVTTIAGGATDGNVDGIGAAAQFGSLEGIAVDADGNVYVSDLKNLNIRKITPGGVVSTLAGSGAAGFTDGAGAVAQFTKPRGLAVDPAGNVLVTDENPALPLYEIRVINKLGVVTTLLKGTSLTGVINGPTSTASVNGADGMTFDPSGNLYISNTGAHVISKVTFK
jgi:sugar lactone lactonase YvrE